MDGVEAVEDEEVDEALEDVDVVDDVVPNEDVDDAVMEDRYTAGSVEGGGTVSTGGAVSGPVGPLGNSAPATPLVAAAGRLLECELPITMAAATATTRTPAKIFQDVVIGVLLGTVS